MILEGEFFRLKKQEYNEKTLGCIKKSVEKLSEIEDKPLMMLGKIQSGKTKSFIGVISLSFDNGYDLAVILTKNSNALAKQTVARMKQEFSEFLEEDSVEIFDIMNVSPNMTKFELEKKLIIVVKKEKNNLPRLMNFIQTYSLAQNKKCLIIDDEADFVSVGYDKNKETEEFDLRKIAAQINELKLQTECKFIQVTATPYSLYLQPENIDLGNDIEIKPVKPYKTVLVPSGEGYIGGEYYFDREKNPLGEYLFHAIEEAELTILKSSDRRKFKEEDILISNKIEGLRTAILNFITGGCIRILQNGGNPRGKSNKFSFIIHTEISKNSHARQENIIEELLSQLKNEVQKKDTSLLDKFIENSYFNMIQSVEKYGFENPSLEEVIDYVKKAIKDEWLSKVIVNSENDINTLLDDNGQLRLRTPLNIFIGGQILDRGITINNLIGFYYGRNPNKMQQDTVLQHSRMYGYRSEKDLAVTRFYTTKNLYEKMSQINDFDAKLREDFEQGNFNKGIIFISTDGNGKIIPCSPQKIRISNTQFLKEGKTITPIGFQTGYKTHIKDYIKEIDRILRENNKGELKGKFTISKDEACNIIDLIYKTIEIENNNCVDRNTFISLINYLSTSNKINVYCGVDRNISRLRETSRYYSDMPYNRDNDLRQAKELAYKEPTLMLMRQNGLKDNDWMDAEFYWPVLVVQKNVPKAIYTSEVLK
ncbi:MAG: Z1 domain-containing protein [Cetobacterium sp.]